MTRPSSKRMTAREQAEFTRNHQQGSENMYGDVRERKGIAAPVMPDMPKPRAPRKPSTGQAESQILRAILQLLRAHPKVAKVWRQNSGTAIMGHGEKQRYVRMNSARGMSDIAGLLKDGRFLAIECKSATGTVQPHQQEFLDSITTAGGVAFIARSVEDVITQLNLI